MTAFVLKRILGGDYLVVTMNARTNFHQGNGLGMGTIKLPRCRSVESRSQDFVIPIPKFAPCAQVIWDEKTPLAIADGDSVARSAVAECPLPV